MNIASPRIGFIGAGRLGKALAWGFAAHGLDVVRAASRDRRSAVELASHLPGCEAATAQQTVDACDLVFITTPDSAIEPTVDALRWRPGVAVVHCSGVTEVAALGKAAREGASTGGFHPMQTFGDPHAAMRSLPGCTVTIEAAAPLDELLVAIAARLGCPVNRLPPGMRGRYHAAAGYTSQFINVLFREACDIWRSLGRDRGRGGTRTAADGARHAGVDRVGGHCRRHARAGIARRRRVDRQACQALAAFARRSPRAVRRAVRTYGDDRRCAGARCRRQPRRRSTTCLPDRAERQPAGAGAAAATAGPAP